MHVEKVPAPEVVAVSGSCRTRDIFNSRFNPGYSEFYDVSLYANQSSIIAMMSPPVEAAFEPLRELSDLGLDSVRSDLTREFRTELGRVQPDVLVLDFFGDVHCGVARLPDGRFVTDNRWTIRHTDPFRSLRDSGKLAIFDPAEDEDGYFTMWAGAMDRFAAHVADTCPRARVVVHRGYHARRKLVPGRSRPVPFRGGFRLRKWDLDRADAWWARLDDHALQSYGWESVDLRDPAAPTYAEHPWGPSYGHFTPDYHQRFLAELHKISLDARLDQHTLRRLEAVERAAVGPWQRQLTESRAVIRDLRSRLRTARARVDELEGLGVVRAARFAARQHLRRRSAR